MIMDKEQILSQTSLFERISISSRKALADICLPKNIYKKSSLFHEGDKGYSIYILVTGSIKLYKTAPDGKEAVIKIIKPGELFGEVVLFEQNTYPVSALALMNSFLFMIPKFQFLCLLKNEGFMKDFIGTLMQKMRYLTQKIQYLSLHDVEDRFFHFLKDQYGMHEKIRLSITKKDLAKAIGTKPETLSRLLLRLKGEEKARWEDRVVTVSKKVWNNLKRM
jgi:CRP/FNR family transcriptional regulator